MKQRHHACKRLVFPGRINSSWIDRIIFGKCKNSKRNIIFQGIRMEMTPKFATTVFKNMSSSLACLIIIMFLPVIARPTHFQIQILVLAQTGRRSQKRRGEGP